MTNKTNTPRALEVNDRVHTPYGDGTVISVVDRLTCTTRCTYVCVDVDGYKAIQGYITNDSRIIGGHTSIEAWDNRWNT